MGQQQLPCCTKHPMMLPAMPAACRLGTLGLLAEATMALLLQHLTAELNPLHGSKLGAQEYTSGTALEREGNNS